MNKHLILDETTRVARASSLVTSEIDNEVVILEMSSGQYFSLAGVSAFLWQEVDAAKPIGQLIDRVHESYEIDRETCREEIINFSAELISNQLWRRVDPA